MNNPPLSTIVSRNPSYHGVIAKESDLSIYEGLYLVFIELLLPALTFAFIVSGLYSLMVG